MKSIKIKKGHNLKISGNPDHKIIDAGNPDFISFHPSRIKSFKTKLMVKINDKVHKKKDCINFVIYLKNYIMTFSSHEVNLERNLFNEQIYSDLPTHKHPA